MLQLVLTPPGCSKGLLRIRKGPRDANSAREAGVCPGDLTATLIFPSILGAVESRYGNNSLPW